MQTTLEAERTASAPPKDGAVPACIGIILDGNRRWAKAQGLSTLEGHRVGLLETYKKIARHAQARGVKHLVAFMFSTENWSRSEEEVAYLMDLFREAGKKELKELTDENVRIRFIGQREKFAPDLQELMMKVETESATKDGMTAWICLSYGGRAEIVAAVNQLIQEGKEVVSESDVRDALWSAEMPDPDIIIRTSGEERLSGFLLWQSAYSELFFTKTYWPAFSEEEFDAILAEFATRERRHGK
jgi:undecaprenyl diphosphate synthase